MIRKIVLSNFMAHAHTELLLADGLTVLVGPNNIGKSTVALALKILARNTNSNFVMQHEQKECSVCVETSEGHSIEWIKKKSPSYRINGQAKDRLGRGGTPPELDSTLRLAPVEFEDKDFEPHFGDQKSPIFLINRPPSQVAQFFSTTSDAEKLVAMQRLHQRNRTETQTQAKLLTAKNVSIQQCLDALVEVPRLEKEWESLERESISLASLANEIAELERLVETFARLTVEMQMERLRANCFLGLLPVPTIHPIDHLSGVIAAWDSTEEMRRSSHASNLLLAKLTTPPKIEDLKPLATMAMSLEQAKLRFDYCDESVQAQAVLEAPCKWIATEVLASAIMEIALLNREVSRLEAIRASTEALTDLPTLLPDQDLANAVGLMSHATREQIRVGELLSTLDGLKGLPVVADTQFLSESIQGFEKTEAQFTKNETLLYQIRMETTELESEAQRWLSTDPTCHVCGGKLSTDSLRLKAHRHEA